MGVLFSLLQSLGTYNSVRTYGFMGLTALELTGNDRPRLLSEVFAVLADLQCNIVEAKGDNDIRGARTTVAMVVVHTERRLHQMMFADRDYERKPINDMQYVVLHATIDSSYNQAYMEFYIRHSDGSPISSEVERQRVIQCVQASIERRVTHGSIDKDC
ncbi:hypothetical protein IFM89_019903 [Coptis chinensis]|uniref:ACT domain-containing protein ACR n=1 Tax=Coptis chinensis TaxID=261450 RepID=A0A835I6D7_9MAGN|nr:hypothetical protein IFM89_019903 [Coptis chinensis]